jgi:L-lactate dehydrogenase complex protein LldG
MEEGLNRSIATNTAREEVLASIRKNLAASAAFEEGRPGPRKAGLTKGGGLSEESAVTSIERFRKSVESVGGKCVKVDKIEAAVKALRSIIDKVDPSRIAFSDSPVIAEIRDSITTDAEIIDKAAARELFGCDIGITSAQWAIAETGTLVLESGKEFSRLTSLLPPVHVCVLYAASIRETMVEILEAIKNDLSPAVTFITGPSRTSDIELTLAIGVHGPRELHVIVIDDPFNGSAVIGK